MRRVVRIDDTERFEFLWLGFLLGTERAVRGIMGLRTAASLATKLEEISTEGDQLPGMKEHLRHLRTGEQALVLSEPEFQLLKEGLENAPWRAGSSKAAIDVYDWFCASEQVS